MGCIFCGGLPVTREHVLAKSLRSALLREPGVPMLHYVVRTGRTIERESTELDFVVRAVCRRCNEGWTSRLERERWADLHAAREG